MQYSFQGVWNMNRKTDAEKLDSLYKRYDRQNEYIKNNYDRISVTFPKGTKERIKNAGFPSVNAFINEVVASALKQLENRE